MVFLTVGGPYPSIAQNKKAAVSWSISAFCVHCFPFTVIKYHDQGNLQREEVVWTQRSRGVRVNHGRKHGGKRQQVGTGC